MDKGTMRMVHMVAFGLVIIGALNWGLVGLLNLNLVEMLLGMGMLANVVYILVGLSALYIAVGHKKDCRICSGK